VRRAAAVRSRPLIGISSYGRGGKRKSFSLPCEYVDVVCRAGGVPVVLPAVEGEIPEALDAIGGLILSGGGDIDPAHYGGTPHDANYGISPERDGFELALARVAVQRPDLPLLCICRGMQVLNVALGGDLVAHIPDHYGDDVLHRHPERRPVQHPVRIAPESRIAGILGATTLAVRSWHHQAVGQLGAGLRAVAWSPDGVVEAVESEDHPFAFGVQWHPETGALRDARQLRLFEALIAAAGAMGASDLLRPPRGSTREAARRRVNSGRRGSSI
jgi:putative glutamine amidotransferase